MEHKTSDLEIEVSARTASTYAVSLRFIAAGSDSEQRLLGDSTTTIEQSAFDLLQDLDPGSEAYAKTLSAAFFTNPLIAVAFEKAVSASQSLNALLRIRLLLDPNRPELHTIQWECLRDLAGSPITTDHRNLFSRYLPSLDWQPPSFTPTRKLKALIAIANPSNLDDFSLATIASDTELANFRKSLPNANIEVLNNPTILTLAKKLHENFDVLYLICHGAIVDAKPSLLLCNEEGKVDLVLGERLAGHIKDLPIAPRLIFLASCQSAQGTGSLAPLLAQAGVPAIVAMNGNFPMKANAAFMPQFFESLSADGLIDRAMSIARGTLRGDSSAWMPILYMRLRTGLLWQSLPTIDPPKSKSKRTVLYFALAAAFSYAAWTFWPSLANLREPSPSINVSLTAEKWIPVNILQEATTLAIPRTFSKQEEWLFMTVSAIVPGYLYFFEDRYSEIHIRIPRDPGTYSERLQPQTQLRIPQNPKFYLPRISQSIYLVWSASPIDELKEAIASATKGEKDNLRLISDKQKIISLRTKLEQWQQLTTLKANTIDATLQSRGSVIAQKYIIKYQ